MEGKAAGSGENHRWEHGLGLEAGVGLNSGGEGLRLTDFELCLRGMQGVTERNSLNWLFGVSCMVFGLSSCVWGSSDSISGELIGMRSSV